MQALSEDPREMSNWTATKERFFDLLDEVVERHKLVVVLENDVEGRDAIRDEVVMVVIPLFQKFTRKQKDTEFNKSMFASSCLSFGFQISFDFLCPWILRNPATITDLGFSTRTLCVLHYYFWSPSSICYCGPMRQCCLWRVLRLRRILSWPLGFFIIGVVQPFDAERQVVFI
ncbi:hypothetical protein BYT27DRAFT_6747892 [Phlegmacium glaucopus]|nr:hypothetical protein BYT27DRAFT_6747892 [Phlegmacium glaucopus]